MKLGIVATGCKREKNFFKFPFFKKKIEYINHKIGDFDITIAKIYVSGKRHNKVFSKVKQKLERISDIVFYTDFAEGIKSFDEKKVKEFFFEISLMLYKKYIGIEKLKPYKQKLLIFDERLAVMNKKRSENICFWISECCICSENREKAQYICTYMKEKCGAYFNTTESQYDISDFDVVFDLDKFYLKIGKNILINRFDFGLSEISDEYKISQLELSAGIYNKGKNPYLSKLEGRCVFFSF